MHNKKDDDFLKGSIFFFFFLIWGGGGKGCRRFYWRYSAIVLEGFYNFAAFIFFFRYFRYRSLQGEAILNSGEKNSLVRRLLIFFFD